jgi:hypothetical protein
MKDNEVWHIPFKGRNDSGVYKCNFLWGNDNVYVMDNHRLSLWCWLRHLNEEEKINIFHVDQHYDCRSDCHDQWMEDIPNDLERLSLTDYINCLWESDGGQVPLFRYDNYLSLFLDKFKDKISTLYLACHDDGDFPNFDNIEELNLFDLLGCLNARCNGFDNEKCIINVDLDYFTETGFGDPFVVVTDEYLDRLGGILKSGLDNKKILCLTFAFSPEWVGSWEIAEKLFKKISHKMGLAFKLKEGKS